MSLSDEVMDFWNEVGNGQPFNRVCITDFHSGRLELYIGYETATDWDVFERSFCVISSHHSGMTEDEWCSWFEQHFPNVTLYEL